MMRRERESAWEARAMRVDSRAILRLTCIWEEEGRVSFDFQGCQDWLLRLATLRRVCDRDGCKGMARAGRGKKRWLCAVDGPVRTSASR